MSEDSESDHEKSVPAIPFNPCLNLIEKKPSVPNPVGSTPGASGSNPGVKPHHTTSESSGSDDSTSEDSSSDDEKTNKKAKKSSVTTAAASAASMASTNKQISMPLEVAGGANEHQIENDDLDNTFSLNNMLNKVFHLMLQ